MVDLCNGIMIYFNWRTLMIFKALFPRIFCSSVSLEKMGDLFTESMNDIKNKFPGEEVECMN